MASITAPQTSTPIMPAAAFTYLGTCAFTALGVFGDGTDGADHAASDFFVIAGATAVAVAVIFGVVVPRVERGSRAAGVGLGLSLVGLLFVLVYWSGLTPPLAVGGILLGAAARRAGHRPGLGGAAIAIGALALVGYASIYALDWLSTHNIAGL
jgi:hypothetical protein